MYMKICMTKFVYAINIVSFIFYLQIYLKYFKDVIFLHLSIVFIESFITEL